MLCRLFCSRNSGKLVSFVFGFGGRRCDGGCVGGAVVEEEAMGICVGDGKGPEGGGFDGTRGGLRESEGKVSATEGDGEVDDSPG